MIRVRFTTDGNDYRPVKFPPKHPWWCSGYDSHEEAIIVAYVDSEEQVAEYWPDYDNFDILENEVAEYTFTTRFPKPDWLNV